MFLTTYYLKSIPYNGYLYFIYHLLFKVFQHNMFLARSKHDVLDAVDNYIKDSVLFPPGQWDLEFLKPSMEDINHLSSQRHLKRNQNLKSPPRRRKLSNIENEIVPEKNHVSVLPVRRDTLISDDDLLNFVEG